MSRLVPRRAIVQATLLAGLLLGGAARGESARDGLAIVAPRRFHAALEGFVRWKESIRPTMLVALEDALSRTGGADDAERLKLFLHDAWKRGQLGFVLLVGDADVMPVRYMVLDRVTAPAHDYAFYPSDLYFADLLRRDGSFDDWNSRKEGFHGAYYGEVRGERWKEDPINFDAVDYRPDVAVGRWPASAPEEVARIAEKTIAFERAVLSGFGRDRRMLGLFAVDGWVDTRAQLDAYVHRLPSVWDVEKRYFARDGDPFATPPPNAQELRALLARRPTIVAHTGHGSDHSWEGCFSTGHIDKLEAVEPAPIMISIGCSTARFATLPPYEAYVDASGTAHTGTNAGQVFASPPPPPATCQKGEHNPTGLGEQLLRRGPGGAVAYIGCNTGSQPCALTLLDGFLRGVASERRPTLGGAWSAAVAHYYDAEHLETIKPNESWYPASIFFQGMKFMLFGDPSLLLPASYEVL